MSQCAGQGNCRQPLSAIRPPRQIPPGPEEAQKLLINFMPMTSRSIQGDGLTIFYIRYWHPVFVLWREQRLRVRVRYHPEDLSRVYVSADGRNYVEAYYADLRRPVITLWEQRAAIKALRAANQPRLSGELLFRAIGQQRKIVEQARKQTRSVKAGRSQQAPLPAPIPPQAAGAESPGVDYSKPAEPYKVEIWE